MAISNINKAANDKNVSPAFGTLLLYRLALEGDGKAQSSFVEKWVKGQLANGIYAGSYWNKTIPWFEAAYAKGYNKMTALVIANNAYRLGNVKKAREYWFASNTCKGLYFCGMSYCDDKEWESAFKCFNKALESRYKKEDAKTYHLVESAMDTYRKEMEGVKERIKKSEEEMRRRKWY